MSVVKTKRFVVASVLVTLLLVAVGAWLATREPDLQQVWAYYDDLKAIQYPRTRSTGLGPASLLFALVRAPGDCWIPVTCPTSAGRGEWWKVTALSSRLHSLVEGYEDPSSSDPGHVLLRNGRAALRFVPPTSTTESYYRWRQSVLYSLAAAPQLAGDGIEELLLPGLPFGSGSGESEGAAESAAVVSLSLTDLRASLLQEFRGIKVFAVRRVVRAGGDWLLLCMRSPVGRLDGLSAGNMVTRLAGELVDLRLEEEAREGTFWPVPRHVVLEESSLVDRTAVLTFNLPWWQDDSPAVRAAEDSLAYTLGQVEGVENIRLETGRWPWQRRHSRDLPARKFGPPFPGEAAAWPNALACSDEMPAELADVLKPGPLSLSAVGDVSLARKIRVYMDERGEDYPFRATASDLAETDLTFINLEAALSTQGTPVPGKGIWLRGRPESAQVLRQVGVDLINLANNHILDYDRPSLLETTEVLARQGFLCMGWGNDDRESRSPLLVDCRGRRLGFLGYTEYADIFWHWDYQQTFEAKPGLAGVAQLRETDILQDISRWKDSVDGLVLSLHWGPEYIPLPTPEHRALAHAAVEAGAAAVIGHHPHVTQAIEIHQGRPILYSLGNFIFDQRQWERVQSMIAELRWHADAQGDRFRVSELRCTPVVIHEGQPQPVAGDLAQKVRDRLQKYSAEYGTSFERSGEDLLISPIQ